MNHIFIYFTREFLWAPVRLFQAMTDTQLRKNDELTEAEWQELEAVGYVRL